MSAQRSDDRTRRFDARNLLAAGGGGLLLFLSDYPVELPWLALFAFALFFWAILAARHVRDASVFGLVFALCRYAPLGILLEGIALPLTSALGLSLYVLVLELAFALVVYRVRAASPWVFAVVVAGAYTAFELVDSVLPMYGTGRTVERVWAAWPAACGAIRWVGGPVFVFVIVGIEALIVAAIHHRKRAPLVGAASLFAAVAVLAVAPAPAAARTHRVAAVGWNRPSDADTAEAYVARAAAAGARLVVFPEVAFEVRPGGREPFERRFSALAREHAIALAVPFADHDRPGNRVLVFDATGRKLGEYAKHHLVPFAERFPASDGPVFVFEVDRVRVGVLICQDDNFRDLAREYTKRGVALVVVPTFEMSTAVAPYHLRSSALRAVENGFAVVRAVAQGQSSVIAPGGSVVAVLDHEKDGPGVLVTDVPIPAP